MKNTFTKLLLSVAILFSINASARNLWQPVDAARAPKNLQWRHPSQFLVYTMDEATLKLMMWNLSEDPTDGIIISLPLPDGNYRDFRVWQTPMMPASLARRYPAIKTFTGEAVGNSTITAKLDFTEYGFSGMIYDGENTSFIDPYDNYRDGFYMVHYKRDETKHISGRMQCEVKDDNEQPGGVPLVVEESGLPKLAQKTFNGHTLRVYDLALCANNFYCQAATGLANPTIAEALSKMTTTMNRVNGVYNREFSVQMNFVANEDTLIWTKATGTINGNDPFNASNSSGVACLPICQTTCTNRIGSANYDCGHVFTTGGGGISGVGIVCNNSQKARSVTGLSSPVGDGFDIDYVAHEMGHEFGSNHTFNNNSDGSCSGNASTNNAYEPASGSTILAYAGICPPDNIQAHSDVYFHASSLIQIQAKLAGSQNACATKTATANKLVSIAPFTASYTIPYKTPFELIAPTAVDSVADTMTSYCWEQWNRGDFGSKLRNTYFKGPIFRSYSPKAYDPTRIFPKNSMVLSGQLTSVTANFNMGEKVPDTTRILSFKLTLRNIINGYGCFLIPDDTIHVEAMSTGAAHNYAGFKVTSQDTVGVVFDGGTIQTITWAVVGTNAAPVNAANVKIFMSTDGGNTWPATLGTFPNTGSALITLPNPATTSSTVRFKVKGDGNIFFNVNLKNVTVKYNPNPPTGFAGHTAPLAASINVYPVPAHDMLHIAVESPGELKTVVYNVTGQLMWRGNIGKVGTTSAVTEIPVGLWARGVYHIRFADVVTGALTVKTVVLE